MDIRDEKLKYARTAAQNFLQFFKFEKFEEFEAQGLLRSGSEFHFGSNLIPAIKAQTQVEFEFPAHVEQTVNIMLKNATDSLGHRHF